MFGKKLIPLVVLCLLGISFAASAVKIDNKWNQSIFLAFVGPDGRITLGRADGHKTSDFPQFYSATVDVIGVGAWAMGEHGKGIRGDYFHCSSDTFISDKIDQKALHSGTITINKDKNMNTFVFGYK